MSQLLPLTDEERRRFTDWLEFHEHSDLELAAQKGKLGPTMGVLALHYRMQAAAMRVVINILNAEHHYP
jgi:hypothetical protein